MPFRPTLRRLSALLCLFAPLPALADIDHQALARDPVWLRLLHMQPAGLLGGGQRSAIHDPAFFLAAQGASDPLAELQATLLQLQAGSTEDADQSALCRFPARALWLQRQQAVDGLPDPFRHCPALREWSRNDSVHSISLVFATGYLDNPASYYGHTLLKLNFSQQASRGRLRDTSINYGAIEAQQDDPVSYIFKGVFGGYDGGFSESEFFMLENNYAENEFRDVWEYQLALDADEQRLILAHVWEVLGKRYTYFFFRENCAYRIAELLQIAGDVDLIPPLRPWTIPQSVLSRLEQARSAGDGVLHSLHYWPSRQSRFYQRLDSLQEGELQLFHALAAGDSGFDDAPFSTSTLEQQQRILDTLLDYGQYARDPDAGRDARSPLYREALRRRYLLPPGIPQQAEAELPVSPHAGRQASWLQLGVSHDSRSGREALALRLRPAYYDWLDIGSDHSSHAALSMADISLQISDDELRLRRFDIIGIESANPGRSGLPGDRGTAWNLKASIEPVRLDCDSCLVPRLASDIGIGRQLAPSLYAAAYVGGALQHERDDYGFGYARASLRLLFRPARQFAVRLDYGHNQPFGNSDRDYASYQLEARQALGRHFDLRLRHEHNGASETSLGLGYYW